MFSSSAAEFISARRNYLLLTGSANHNRTPDYSPSLRWGTGRSLVYLL